MTEDITSVKVNVIKCSNRFHPFSLCTAMHESQIIVSYLTSRDYLRAREAAFSFTDYSFRHQENTRSVSI
jgi:hypothetical protein